MSNTPSSKPSADQVSAAERELLALRRVRAEGRSAPMSEDIALTSVWEMDSPDAADQALGGQSSEFVYRRDDHPNARSLGSKLAALHGAEAAVLTAQGMSATGCVALALLSPGAKVWLSHELYGTTSRMFNELLARWGVVSNGFDVADPAAAEQIANSESDMVVVETISNPTLKIPDLLGLSAATALSGAKLVVDNTFATHHLCRPLAMGADIVVESLGKIVNGHSDAMVGLAACRDADVAKKIETSCKVFGASSSPLDCYLTQRGLSTLAVRMDRACDNALALAKRLQQVAPVTQVDYPGLSSNNQHQLATHQLTSGFGWMLCVQTKLSREAVTRLFRSLAPEIAFAPSLGDVVTTVSHPASTSHRAYSEQQRRALGITEGTIRVSCGIEPTEWLLERFTNAIADAASDM